MRTYAYLNQFAFEHGGNCKLTRLPKRSTTLTSHMDVLSLNQRFIRELLELYRDSPAVWKLKCPEYKNKMAKARAYDLLVQKCREYVPDADREFVKNKINSLRTSFRKELRKVQASQIKAKDGGEVYVPHLWYYGLLTFITEHRTPCGNSVPHEQEFCSYEDESGLFDFKSEPSSPNQAEVLLVERDPLSPTREPSPSPPRSKARPNQAAATSITSASPSAEDVFDAIGKNVAHKLRGMSQQQRIIAEKIISDVMYHGQMETLTVDSRLYLSRS